jgi:hypothetical protein
MQRDPKRELLRHTLATLAYRAVKPLREAPPGFDAFQAGPTARTPVEILAHIEDLLDWALSLAQGRPKWADSKARGWDHEIGRFFAALQKLDDYLASEAELEATPERLFQGPVADVLTHIGQISLLRRLAMFPVRGENFYRADIEAGRVGKEQRPPQREFD